MKACNTSKHHLSNVSSIYDTSKDITGRSADVSQMHNSKNVSSWGKQKYYISIIYKYCMDMQINS